MFGFLKKSQGATDAPKPSWTERLKAGLARTRAALTTPLGELFSRAKIDDELLEELESTLLMADCGIDATTWLLTELRAKVKKEKIESPAALREALIELLTQLLTPLEQPLDLNHPTQNQRPFIIMIAGVNGAGKTTSIGKLAKQFQNEGHTVLLAAGDTFRAAAREQLTEWGRRNDVTVIAQPSAPPANLASLGSPPKGAKNPRGGPSSFSGDPAAVVFDAIGAARARGIDVMMADTAGRLPTQLNLMEEIAKVRRVIQK
ncbi:MAG: signaling recognition particle receptor family protein, partial [Rhodocyclaceae bacterium]|nr:signaling recognition particle receptor family protein [Rhodocyclaceae bacterium]